MKAFPFFLRIDTMALRYHDHVRSCWPVRTWQHDTLGKALSEIRVSGDGRGLVYWRSSPIPAAVSILEECLSLLASSHAVSFLPCKGIHSQKQTSTPGSRHCQRLLYIPTVNPYFDILTSSHQASSTIHAASGPSKYVAFGSGISGWINP